MYQTNGCMTSGTSFAEGCPFGYYTEMGYDCAIDEYDVVTDCEPCDCGASKPCFDGPNKCSECNCSNVFNACDYIIGTIYACRDIQQGICHPLTFDVAT